MLTFHTIHPNNKAPRCSFCGAEGIGHFVVYGCEDDPDHDYPIQCWLCEHCLKTYRLKEAIEEAIKELAYFGESVLETRKDGEHFDKIVNKLKAALE
jgi:hypothetical protein